MTEHPITTNRKVITMKTKFLFLLLLASVLSLSACGQTEAVNTEEPRNIESLENGNEVPVFQDGQTQLNGTVTKIDGSIVTVQLMDFRGFEQGGAERFQDMGKIPETPENPIPPDDIERRELPEGAATPDIAGNKDMPDSGERPMGSMNAGQGETKVLSLENAEISIITETGYKDGSVGDITFGCMLTMELDDEGNVVKASVMDMPAPSFDSAKEVNANE